jgi:hypothetical protein
MNMKDRTKKGIEIIVTAALVGVLGNLLLRQTPWGTAYYELRTNDQLLHQTDGCPTQYQNDVTY